MTHDAFLVPTLMLLGAGFGSRNVGTGETKGAG